MTTTSKARWLAPLLVAVLLCAMGVAEAVAADIKLQAQLVWGTNQDKVQDQAAVDSQLRDKLRRVFQWKNYFEIDRQTFTVPSGGTQKAKLSEDCTVEVTHLGASNFQVRLVGKGRPVVTKRQPIIKGESLVMAGDDKNNTAWFVVLALADK